MRYIEIDSIIEQIKAEHCERCTNHRCALCDIDEALLMLEEADDADVLEVVRCKDCKHWRHYCTDPIVNLDYGNCHCHQWENAEFIPDTTSNDFCSYGERKEK